MVVVVVVEVLLVVVVEVLVVEVVVFCGVMYLVIRVSGGGEVEAE